MEFSISHFNFKDIPFYKYAQDFTFIVNNKQYKTNRIVADILSPKIRKYHFNDEGFNKYTFETHDNEEFDHETMSDSTDYFSEFLQLVENHKIHLDEKHQLIFSEYFYKLGNYEEYLNILSSIPDSNRASENQSIQFLQQISKKNFFEEINLDNDKIKAHINNVSKNFLQINKKEFKRLGIEILEEIIKQKTLQLDEEDSLLEFIVELYSEDRKYYSLLEFVEFRNVHSGL